MKVDDIHENFFHWNMIEITLISRQLQAIDIKLQSHVDDWYSVLYLALSE